MEVEALAELLTTTPEYPFVWYLPVLPLPVLTDYYYKQSHPLLKEIGAAPVSLLRFWQAHRCGICGDETRLVLDHDHRTDLARGFLCHSCNIGEGMGWGGAWELWRLAPPMAILGLPPQRYLGFGNVEDA